LENGDFRRTSPNNVIPTAVEDTRPSSKPSGSDLSEPLLGRESGGGSDSGSKRSTPISLAESVSANPAAAAAAAETARMNRWFNIGAIVFILVNLVGKGVLTLMEAIIAPMYARIRGDDTDASQV
jgi:hypothetical protein